MDDAERRGITMNKFENIKIPERGISIAIIDSGILLDNDFPISIISGKGITRTSSGNYELTDDYSDQIGHGTAVVDQFLKENIPTSHIFCIKIYEESIETDIDALVFALNYINTEIKCDIILISSGVVCCEQLGSLYKIVNDLTENGVLIVSAFDNEGTMSFPAAFDSVIGVAITDGLGEKPRIAEASKVDVVILERMYRLKWVSPSQIIIGGSSFAAPFIAAKLSKIILKYNSDKKIIKSYLLRELAKELKIDYLSLPKNDEYPKSTYTHTDGRQFTDRIKKAAVFPWNKEIHSIARYRSLLNFKIVGFFDVKYAMNIGREIGALLDVDTERERIQNIDSLDWTQDFDTVICGHCNELSKLMKKDLLMEIAKKCQKYNKRIYAFDREIENLSDVCESFTPTIRQSDVPRLVGGRLYERSVPVVGVFGTSSQQGKFSVQLELRKRFIKHGYRVAEIGSEPSGYLFGFNAVFPFGYNSNIDVNPAETTLIVNKMIYDATTANTDVVIVGGQSGTVPYSYNNLSQMNFIGHGFLCGTNPDVFVLCVNPHDPIDYIKNTIDYLHSFNGMPVSSIVLFPMICEAASKLGYGFKRRKLEVYELEQKCKELYNATGVPTRALGNTIDMDLLFNAVIDELS